jgi:ribosomal silencing factor RsfS
MEMLKDEQAEDIVLLDVRAKSTELDYLVIATLHSNRHRRAVAFYVYLQVGGDLMEASSSP